MRIGTVSMLAGALLVVALAVYVGTTSLANKPANADEADWTVATLAEKLAAGASFQLLDVREADEFRAGHMAGAVTLPLSVLRSQLDKLDPAVEYAVICQSGRRSSTAVSILRGAGFAKVHNVLGGMSAWRGPVVVEQ